MKSIKPRNIQRQWHLVDAKNKVLGRLSSQVAQILMGKNKNYFTPHLDTGDYVIVVNAAGVILTGRKETQKKYYHHSLYPGGLKVKTAVGIRQSKPEELIRHAVRGMLPKTKLAKLMLKKLFIFPAGNHPYQAKFKG